MYIALGKNKVQDMQMNLIGMHRGRQKILVTENVY
jgi:hypothetical protein